ncbi:unnamed protein product [Caenorhabditis bovis]|uniref:Sugar phosphate transporter domain-containing protein n=1 Tax=Caenorhabditis bovis TaxID=2654633 RepID=A0A8S1FDS7_9PELO|nr:unnamed protein product [Caenorhabditis bovis]
MKGIQTNVKSLKRTGVRSMILYVFATIFCSLMGKVTVTRFFFDYPIVILMMQSAATLFIVEVFRVLGIIKIAPYSFENGRQLAVPSLLYAAAQWISVASFEGISMPSFDSVKRFTPLFIMFGMAIKNKQQKMDANKTLLILGISFATAIAVNLDLSLDRYSFLFGILGCSLQAAAYLLFEENFQIFSALEVLYMYAFNSLILYIMADIVQDEIRDAFMYLITAAHPLFIVYFIITLIASIAFHWATFACLEKNGALNMQIVSNVRASLEIFIAYYLSIYLFYDVSPGIFNWLFLILTFVGARALYHRDVEPEIVQGPWMTKA